MRITVDATQTATLAMRQNETGTIAATSLHAHALLNHQMNA